MQPTQVQEGPSEDTAASIIQQENELRFRYLFDDNPLPMWLYDCEDLRFLEVNDAAVRRYGYSREEFLAQRISDIRPTEDIPLLQTNLAKERAPLEQSGPWRHRLKDGQLIEVEITSHLIFWNGRRAAFVVVHDVSDRRRAAVALKQSEERFRTAFEYAPLGMCLTSLDGRILQVNAALSRMLGYSEQELLLGSWNEITYPQDVPRSQEALQQFQLRPTASVEFEKRYIHKNGKLIWARLKTSAINGHDGLPSHYISHIEDITERRQAQRALQESEEKYRSLISRIPDVVWVADISGRVAFVSPNVETLFGIGAEEVYGRGANALFDSIDPADAERVAYAFDLLFSCGQPYDMEFRVLSRSGDGVWVHDRALGTYEQDGVRYASGLRSDISERKWAEAAVRERDAAKEANRTKSAFLARMSHELRTPLNAIIGYSQMLLEDCIGPEQPQVREDLERIERSGHFLLGIINDVLDLSRIEAGRVELQFQEVNLAAVLKDVLNAVEPLARQQGNRIACDCPLEAQEAYADLPKFRQSLLNLVNNACKFTRNGEITVAVRRVQETSGSWTEVRVSDTGIGIPPGQIEKLFEPFSQVNGAAHQYNGSGLGLAISKGFCRLMGGDITVESTPGCGSCFSIRVPAPVRTNAYVRDPSVPG